MPEPITSSHPGGKLLWEQVPLSPTLSPTSRPPGVPSHAHVPAVFLDQVFGCSLLALCERERGTVPRFVLQCIWTVERRGTGDRDSRGHQHRDTGTTPGTVYVGHSGFPWKRKTAMWALIQLYWSLSPCATWLWASSRGQQGHMGTRSSLKST